MLNINTSRTRMVTVAGIIIGVSWGAYAIAETIINSQIDEIPNVLKLKVSTEKILDSRIIRDIRNLSDGTIVDLGEISQYDYISNVEVPDEKNEILSERTHNSKSIALPNGKKEMRFYGGSPFRKVGEKWYQVESATTTISAYDLQMKKLSFIEKAFATDFYAPAGDGRVGYQTTTWSAAHNASNGNDADIGSWYDSILGDRKNEVGFFIYRSFFPFDTSAIGDDDRIESASIHFSFVQAATLPTSAVTTNYVIVTTTQASVTSLSNSDYSQIGGTSYGSFSILHSSADGTALSANLSSPDSLISKTGYTKLGAREYDHDFLNVEAVHNYGSAVYDSCQTGTDYDPYLSVVLAATPLASTLQVESQTNPGSISTTTPSFSVIHQNASSTEIATSYQLQITTNPQNFNTLFSDSGKTTLSSSTPPGMRTPQFYATSTFPLNGATYYYRIKLWEQSGLAGPFSTSTSYFTMVDNAYSGPTRQDISYTYDAVGNITNISDFTPTYGTSTVSYTYDQLYRLITASSSNTTVTNWSDSYTYSPIGNISSSTSKGSYSYSQTNYANPHAVTSISTTNYNYDKSGNMIQSGSDTYSWDYQNKMTDSASNGTTNHYLYDTNGDRTQKDEKTGSSATTTTKYWKKDYETSESTTTINLFANGKLIATIEGGSATTTRYITTDHLGSINTVRDGSGNTEETINYYPYGEMNQDEKATAYDSSRKFIGETFDSSTQLSYLNARYMNGGMGRFLSEDPVFLGVPSKQDLINPQSLNSYGYANGNPINGSDPTGQRVDLESRPVFDLRGYDIGEHTFFLITPDHPEQIKVTGVSSGTTAFTFGGYPSGNPLNSYLSKGVGTAESNGMDTNYAFGSGKIINKMTITPPNGESDTEFINSMGAQYNNIDLSDMKYIGTGNIRGFYNGNSNNFAYTLGVKSGVQDQMNSFNPNPNNSATFGAPGYGTSLPTTSIYKQIVAGLTSIKNSLTQLVSGIGGNKSKP